jgi:thiol-disulfide isomerase/thioredoxin
LVLFSVINYAQNPEVNFGDVESINKEKLIGLISHREDKVLLLNIWATWCIPCRQEFPDLIEIANRFSSSVDVVGISVDYPDEVESKIEPFLKKTGVNFTVFVNGFNKDEELIKFLNENWNGALPATFVYDKDGKLQSFLEGKQTTESLTDILNKIKN